MRRKASLGTLKRFMKELAAAAKSAEAHDLEDVTRLLRGGYVSPEELRRRLAEVEPALVRYPAIDPRQFRAKVEDFLNKYATPGRKKS